MPNIALIPGAETRIDALAAVVDGYPDVKHRLDTQTGGEPLEDGREVTDHAVAKEERLTLTGWVSDFLGGRRPADAMETLRRLHKEVTPLSVVTEWGTYPEMLIIRVEANQAGRGMRFEMQLKQVIRVGAPANTLPPDTLAGPAEGRSGMTEQGRVALAPVL